MHQLMVVIVQQRKSCQLIYKTGPVFEQERKNVMNPLLPVIARKYLVFNIIKPADQGVTGLSVTLAGFFPEVFQLVDQLAQAFFPVSGQFLISSGSLQDEIPV